MQEGDRVKFNAMALERLGSYEDVTPEEEWTLIKFEKTTVRRKSFQCAIIVNGNKTQKIHPSYLEKI